MDDTRPAKSYREYALSRVERVIVLEIRKPFGWRDVLETAVAVKVSHTGEPISAALIRGE